MLAIVVVTQRLREAGLVAAMARDSRRLSLVYIFLACIILPAVAAAQFGQFFQGGFPFGQNPFQRQEEAPQTPHRQHKGWTEMEHSGFNPMFMEETSADQHD